MCESSNPFLNIACPESQTAHSDGSSSTGPIVLADVTFGQFTIKNQAISASPSDYMRIYI